jgi:hypothetical protein
MTDIVNLYDAKTNLYKLVDRAAAGEESKAECIHSFAIAIKGQI